MPGLHRKAVYYKDYTSKALWEEGLVLALPEFWDYNSKGYPMYPLQSGDMIFVDVVIDFWNVVDAFYGQDNVIVKYIGVVGTQLIGNP